VKVVYEFGRLVLLGMALIATVGAGFAVLLLPLLMM
jgi:hypothetical protein